jgi:type II restriction/modification system DNA methylase subunit YeeA
MDRTKLKSYAPQARRDFIQAMMDRAALYGLTAKKIEPVVEEGDVAVIAGREHPRAVAKKRKKLEDRIERHGFQQTMEALAYTWFNRLVAIRFMELHGYLDHGYRVLSHPENKPTPEILDHAEHVELPGLKKETVIDLKLVGNKEVELYRLLLTAQCNALHRAMPFLFEWIDDETELLLPDNLLHSDSLIRKLVIEIDEEDWQVVEIIGWLYQFYISDKKDEVIGKVVASEDIPAATQLFTPNWIVKYLVQNTLGRQWLAIYPQSGLRQQMQYYIEPAEQTPEVQAQLKAITPVSLNPEELRLLDPACGSGHILVEAYDLFKAIYQERGYRAKDIPALILKKNLVGLEIDDRAAQLAAFALMMKARADDRSIFDSEAKPIVLAFDESKGMNAADITRALNSPINKGDVPRESLFEEIDEVKAGLFSKKMMAEKGHVSQADIASLLDLFENAKTFGSLIQVPPKLAAKLPEIEQRLEDVLKHGDLTHLPADGIKPLITQARLLARQYDAVVANPPYMGNNGMNSALKEFGKTHYPRTKSDLYAMCVERFLVLTREACHSGFMTPFTWMFISSYEDLRALILFTRQITSLVQPEYHSFFESAYVPICAYTVWNTSIRAKGVFIRLTEFYGEDLQPIKTVEAIQNPHCGWRFTSSSSDFAKLPGSPLAYWISDTLRNLVSAAKSITEIADARQGLATADNERFVRRWWEVDFAKIKFDACSTTDASNSGATWFPYNKGGEFRRWYGNHEFIVNWQNDGREIKDFVDSNGKQRSRPQNTDFYFRESISWSDITASDNAFRYYPKGFIFDACAHSAFAKDHKQTLSLLAYLNTAFVGELAKLLNPTMHFHVGYFKKLPYPATSNALSVTKIAERAIEIAGHDWNLYERSWEFAKFAFVQDGSETIERAFVGWSLHCSTMLHEMRSLEEENNRIFLDAHGLQNEVSEAASDHKLTLVRPDRQEDIQRLLSYVVGCTMGRYSLDKPGLIFADSGNQGFDSSQYKAFRANDDGIIPLLENDWGIRDDAANRTVEFVAAAWPKEHLEDNLKFIAGSLGSSNDEQSRDTIRRYLATGFYKHHLSMYKRRPIYWLFSSGKQRAFQCLVYLHRYHEGTLARMRTEYVIPLQGQIAARIEQLEGDKVKATSTSHRKRLQKEQDDLKKQQAELRTFEEKLKHAAEQKISLDLDDGVKVNYGKFGDLLAEAKAITGGKNEE